MILKNKKERVYEVNSNRAGNLLLVWNYHEGRKSKAEEAEIPISVLTLALVDLNATQTQDVMQFE